MHKQMHAAWRASVNQPPSMWGFYGGIMKRDSLLVVHALEVLAIADCAPAAVRMPEMTSSRASAEQCDAVRYARAAHY
jgi:hypothetical protein